MQVDEVIDKDILNDIKSKYDESFEWYYIPLDYKYQCVLATFSVSKEGKLVFEGAVLDGIDFERV